MNKHLDVRSISLKFVVCVTLAAMAVACHARQQSAPASHSETVIPVNESHSGNKLEQEELRAVPTADFDYIFRGRVQATKFGEKARDRGFRVDVSRENKEHDWLVTVSVTPVPGLEERSEIGDSLEVVAQKYGGEEVGEGVSL